MATTDDIVKDKADDDPGHVVKGRCRRHAGRAGEDKREVEVLEKVDLELLVQNPLE